MYNTEEYIVSLKRIQDFDPNSLSRIKELGTSFNFSEIIEPAQQLINLYKSIPSDIIKDLPENIASYIKGQADTDYRYFTQILDFNPDGIQNPSHVHGQLIKKIESHYKNAFSKLYQYIAYASSKSYNFIELENEARNSINSINARADELNDKLSAYDEQAKNMLMDIRNISAEHGVSQQAIYFKEESENHEKLANKWQGISIGLSTLLVLLAILSISFYKNPYLNPDNNFQSLQLLTSKMLIFGAISYLLFLSAKNFLSHKTQFSSKQT